MGLYAIGDLHLSLSVNKPMDIFGEVWKDHTEKLRASFSQLRDDDTIVLCGDTSWGISLEEALEDFRFLDRLPGRKILLKGNHDYWWETAAKMNAFFAEHEIHTLQLLHNNCFYYGNYALCGTRGWFSAQSGGNAVGNINESSRGQADPVLPALSAFVPGLCLSGDLGAFGALSCESVLLRASSRAKPQAGYRGNARGC